MDYSDANGKKQKKTSRKNREPMLRGLFYPADSAQLDRTLEQLLSGVPASSARVSAIISPHGSLAYSGQLAAKAWRATESQHFETIVLIGPSHRAFDSGVFLSESNTFALPSGNLRVDRRTTRALVRSNSAFTENDIPHLEEHGIEMQLLFAAKLYPECQIIPILVSGVDSTILDELFANLYFCLRDRLDSTLIVLTSNMAVDKDAASCIGATEAFVQSILHGDAQAVEAASCQNAFCGAAAIAAYMRSQFIRGKTATSLGIGSSAEFLSPGEPAVGYAAVCFGEPL